MRLGLLMALAIAASVALPGMASAGTNLPAPPPGKPMFLVGPTHSEPLVKNSPNKAPVSQLTQWNGNFTDLGGVNRSFTQVGGNPATTNGTTTITVLLIPVKFVFTQGGKTYKFDPVKVKLKGNNNRNVITALQDSPIFNSKVDFTPQTGSCKGSCADLGKTQYIDAFQRGTWWGANVGTNTNYHVLFTTKIEKEQTINYSCTGCVIKNPFGNGTVGIYDYGTMDGQLQNFMRSLADVNPGVLPLFVSYDVYLCNPCYVGGYHDADGGQPGGQTYAYATYVGTKGAFSQNVSAISHELGEWMDDPFVDNGVGCYGNGLNGLMEVGDPLETTANYGDYTYKDRKFTYDLQSLVYMPYFGAPTADSANQWYALQDDMNHVCPGQ